ncbi:MAG: heme exporter protein CcmD [Hydrogenophaga sp.]|uniref:heme exporter protein CcmD n=1 Tax=Hydrogenophaga sp. TaxID=1904254 RepID=UPI002617E74E|nr:heme exporter protein CcmD [Hydrogenophaga sp.]MDM7941697.1 heme exporter protein CcmD [Hydrogenophaga sp.]
MNNLGDFLAMGGYGLYVWGSLGMCAAVVAAELMAIRFRRRLLVQEAQQARDDAAVERTA